MMRDTAEIEVRQVRIFPMDSLPTGKLIRPAVAQAFKDRFGWEGAEASKEGDILLRPGLLSVPDTDEVVAIRSLQINDRRMILAVAGESAAANRVNGAILEFFAQATGWKPVEPVVLTQETTCLATLDFEWADLLSPAVVGFARGPMLEALSAAAEPARAEIRGLSFSFRISFVDPPPGFAEHGVALADKRLTVEPRTNTPLLERRFFTSSPTDSDTHFRLLTQLENAVTAGRRP
jgi:hypothetical protein